MYKSVILIKTIPYEYRIELGYNSTDHSGKEQFAVSSVSIIFDNFSGVCNMHDISMFYKPLELFFDQIAKYYVSVKFNIYFIDSYFYSRVGNWEAEFIRRNIKIIEVYDSYIHVKANESFLDKDKIKLINKFEKIISKLIKIAVDVYSDDELLFYNITKISLLNILDKPNHLAMIKLYFLLNRLLLHPYNNSISHVIRNIVMDENKPNHYRFKEFMKYFKNRGINIDCIYSEHIITNNNFHEIEKIRLNDQCLVILINADVWRLYE